MAVITPQSDVYLLKVPLEIDNENQLTFTNASAQYNYFSSLPKVGFDDFTYIRKDGVLRVPAIVDDLYEYNYVMYRNDAYSDKWFYAYITGMTYMNDNVTDVSIATDTFQTWQFDLRYKKTFVEREHVNDDTVGLHTIPEGLELGEYEVVDLRNSPIYETTSPSTDWLVCFAVSKLPSGTTSIAGDNGYIGGVFNSLYFFATRTMTAARQVIDIYNADQDLTADAILNIYMIPSCCVNINLSTGNLADGSTPTHIGTNPTSIYPLYNYYTSSAYQLQQPSVLAENYTPVNKKLLTYPFSYFYLSNNSGEDVIYHYEDFPIETVSGNTARTMTYKKCIVPSTSLSGKLYFTKYKSYSEGDGYGTKMYQYGINYAKVPVCAWTTDYYTNWLTQNGVNVAMGTARDLALTAGGVITAAALTGGVGAILAGGVGLASGLTSIGSALGEAHKAEVTPPQAHGDINTGDFNYAYLRNSVSIYEMSIRPEYAKIIDSYFSMYGYKVNEVKVPNINGRRNWNYVKTVGCYIDADIPQDDLQQIKDLFNKGITFWHNPATFADYSQNNDII